MTPHTAKCFSQKIFHYTADTFTRIISWAESKKKIARKYLRLLEPNGDGPKHGLLHNNLVVHGPIKLHNLVVGTDSDNDGRHGSI